MSLLVKNLSANDFVRKMATLLSGTAAGQAILLIASPLLTRLYTPEHFGIAALVGSVLAVIGVFASLRYEMAIPLPSDDDEAAQILVLCFMVLFGVGAITLVFVFCLGGVLSVLLNAPELGDYLWLLPVGVVVQGAYVILCNWGIRERNFVGIAKSKILQSSTAIFIQLSAPLLGAGGLVLGQVAGQGIGALTLARFSIKKRETPIISWRKIRACIRRYRNFPIHSTWAGLLNTGGSQLPTVLIGIYFGAPALGLYALSQRVLSLPVNLLGEALQNVFFSESVASYRRGELAAKVENLLYALVQLACPPLLIIIHFLPILFETIFGAAWRDAGVIAQWMVPWLAMQFWVAPLSVINAVTENQRLGLLMQAQLFLVRLASIVFGAYAGDILTAIQFFSIGSVLSYALFLWAILATCGLSIFVFLKALAKGVAFGGVISLPVAVYATFFEGPAILILTLMMSISLFGLRAFVFAKRGV